MKFMHLTVLLLTVLFTSCQTAPEEQENPLPPFPFEANGDSPTMLGPEVLSTLSPEFATNLRADHGMMTFNRMSPDREEMYLYTAAIENGEVQEPQLYPYWDTTFWDIDPFLFEDRLYFSSSRQTVPDSTGQMVPGDYDVYYSDWTELGWSAPKWMEGAINTDDDEIFITFTAGGVAYYSVFANGYDDVVIKRLDTKNMDASAETLQFENDTARLTNPAIAPDGSFLILSNGNLVDGYGRADLYVSFPNKDGSWTGPHNLGPKINNEYTQFAPGVSPDGKYLFFTSEEPGIVQDLEMEGRRPGDLYVIELTSILEEIRISQTE